jgi:Nif-specific regulatory protein
MPGYDRQTRDGSAGYIVRTKSGVDKGGGWTLGERPLVIGREKACDIRIADPLVSRRHCEIAMVGRMVWLRDLGSRNATYINGDPVNDAELKAGDEITVGNVTFVLQAGTASVEPAPMRTGSNTTMSLADGEAVYLSDSALRNFDESGLQSVSDVFVLFRFSRNLGRVHSLQELAEVMKDVILKRLKPLRLWLALNESGADRLDYRLSYSEEPDGFVPPPESALLQALGELRGFLVPERIKDDTLSRLRLTLVAPIFFGNQAIGAVAAQTQTPQRAYDETDLQFLVALAYAAAPFFGAIEQRHQLEQEVEMLRAVRQQSVMLVGDSPATRRVLEIVALVAPTLQSVLIIGETGTGKELVARLIHDSSDRVSGPLLTLNCAAIPTDLIESELFGYEKGAFTGAHERRIGLLEQSDGGTLFLDEVGDLSPESQARILRAIETRRFRRVGGKEEIASDFRIIAATNKDVSNEAEHPEFRRDLYHRLRGVQIRVPALRERRSDIPALAEHFLLQARRSAKHPLRGFAPDALEYLTTYSWPGNVRELEHCIEAAVMFSRSEFITDEDLHTVIGGQTMHAKPIPLQELERRHILQTLKYCDGHVFEASKLLGIGKTKLYERLNEYRAQGHID